jgi:hypothetical protein
MKPVVSTSVIMSFMLLALACNDDEGLVTTISTAPRSVFEMSCTNQGFVGIESGMWAYHIDVTVQESAGLGSNINFFRALHANGGHSDIGSDEITKSLGNNRIEGNTTWGPYTLDFRMPERSPGVIIVGLSTDITDDSGFQHTLECTF